jgi:carboxypeptidase Taq
LVRVAKRDFEKAIKVPADYVARASAAGSASYDAWTRARPADDFATMATFLERTIEKLWGGRRRSWHLHRPYELN